MPLLCGSDSNWNSYFSIGGKMIHTIFQLLLPLYEFLYIMVIIQWNIIFVDFYIIGWLYDLRVLDKKIIGLLFGWVIFDFISIQYLIEIPSITEVFLPGFFLDMTIVVGMSLTYGRIKAAYKEFIIEPRILMLKLFCYISLFTMIFSYLK